MKFPESERSPAVFIANWKETVDLRRKLGDIARSRQTVSTSIHLDQKLLYRRFQAKLHNSKIAFSRITGDREMEKQLRMKAFPGFNTICGNGDGDERSLDRILKRVTNSRAENPRTLNSRAPTKYSLIPASGRGLYRSKSDDDVSSASDDELNLDLSKDDIHVSFGNQRQNTSYESNVSMPPSPTRSSSRNSATYLDTSLERCHASDYVSSRAHTMPELKSNLRKESVFLDRQGAVSTFLDDQLEKRRQLLSSINQRRLQSSNFDSRVRRFCRSVDDIGSKTDLAFDYYNVRLFEMNKNSNRNKHKLPVPKTPESEYWRHVGDLRRRPMTLHAINRDVSN